VARASTACTNQLFNPYTMLPKPAHCLIDALQPCNAAHKAKGMQQLLSTYCSRQGWASHAKQLHKREAPVAACKQHIHP
jgi:putative hemolysin